MQQRHIKQSSVLALFLGVAIFADLLPWPGLGAGLIQTMAQTLFTQDRPVETILNSQDPLAGSEVSSQNSFLSRPGNGG